MIASGSGAYHIFPNYSATLIISAMRQACTLIIERQIQIGIILFWRRSN